MPQLKKITLPLVNPVHVSAILGACADVPAGEDVQAQVEQVRFEEGDTMRADDSLRFLVDAGVLARERSRLVVTPEGRDVLESVLATGAFDSRRWLRFLFSRPDPDAPARYFIHHGIRFLDENGPQPDRKSFREGFSRYLRAQPEVLEYLVEDGTRPEDWWYSGATMDRLIRCLKVWRALDEDAPDIRLALTPDDLRGDRVDDDIPLEEFVAHLMVAYQTLVFRHSAQQMFPIWKVRQAFLDQHPVSQGRFYELLEQASFDDEYRDLITLYRGAGEADRQEFLEVKRGGTRDLYYLMRMRA